MHNRAGLARAAWGRERCLTEANPLFLILAESDHRSFAELATEIGVVDGVDVEAHRDGTIDVLQSGLAFWVRAGARDADLQAYRSLCTLDQGFGRTIEIGLGDHIVVGITMPSIMQAYLSFGERCANVLGAVAVGWHPAALIMGTDYFSQAVRDRDNDGAFPI